MKRRRCVIILGAFLIGTSLIGYTCHKTRDAVKTIKLAHFIRIEMDAPIFTGPLLKDERFIEIVRTSKLQEIRQANQVRALCLIDLTSKSLRRYNEFYKVSPKRRINCATRGDDKVFFVEDFFAEPGKPTEILQMIGDKGLPERIFSTNRAADGGDPRHIHSLSLSHSGRHLAFFVSADNRWRNWRNQSLMIYDTEKKTIQEIWKGDIQGSEVILNPYEWVQPLPWTPDDKKVLLSTSSEKILSIDIDSGAETNLCNGYLPIGFVEKDRYLVLKRGSLLSTYKWRISSFDLQTGKETAIVNIAGPAAMRSPLVSPTGEYVSFVTRIFPLLPGKDLYLYTFIVRLDDLSYALVEAEITAWSKR